MPKRDTIVAFPEIAAVPAATRGKQVKGLEHVQKYLNRFGYIAEMEICEAGVLDDMTVDDAQALPAQARAARRPARSTTPPASR